MRNFFIGFFTASFFSFILGYFMFEMISFHDNSKTRDLVQCESNYHELKIKYEQLQQEYDRCLIKL